MANVFKPKRSSTASLVPTTTNLASGEMGVNMADQKVYINNGTSVVQIGAGKLSGLSDVTLTSLSNGQTLTWNGTAFVNTTGGSGTVTSVALSLPSLFTVSGSPVTTTGTLTATLASQTANQVLAAPNGSNGAPTFRALAAADIPVLTLENLPDAWAKRAVKVATTANITLSGTQTIDGVAVVAGDRVLVKDQTASAANGIYVVAAGAWTRSTDADAASELSAAMVAVDQGTTNGGLSFDTDFKSTDTLGTTAMTWSRSVDVGYFTTIGNNLVRLTNPSAVTFPRFNADNTVSALDAATFRTAIGAGTSSTTGTVTSVGGTGTVSGLSLSGTVTTTGNLTLGGTLAVTPANFASQTANTVLAAPNGVAGVPTFRALAAADIPTLNQNTTGSAATLTTGRTIAMTGDVSYTSPSFNGSANVTAAATLATVNSNVGSFGSATAIPVVTVNAKGLVTAVSTATVAGGQYFGSAATKAISYNANTISENVTVTNGNNGLSAGPITISSGFTVTVESGANWVII